MLMLTSLLLLLLMLLLGVGLRKTMIVITEDDNAVYSHDAADAPQGPTSDDNVM